MTREQQAPATRIHPQCGVMCQWGRARQGVGCQVRFVCSCSGAVHATARAQKHCQTNLKCHALRPQPACCQNRVENENCRETPRAPCFPVPVGVRSYRLPRPSPRRVEKPRPNNGGVEHEREDARLLARAQNHDETQTGGDKPNRETGQNHRPMQCTYTPVLACISPFDSRPVRDGIARSLSLCTALRANRSWRSRTR